MSSFTPTSPPLRPRPRLVSNFSLSVSHRRTLLDAHGVSVTPKRRACGAPGSEASRCFPRDPSRLSISPRNTAGHLDACLQEPPFLLCKEHAVWLLHTHTAHCEGKDGDVPEASSTMSAPAPSPMGACSPYPKYAISIKLLPG